MPAPWLVWHAPSAPLVRGVPPPEAWQIVAEADTLAGGLALCPRGGWSQVLARGARPSEGIGGYTRAVERSDDMALPMPRLQTMPSGPRPALAPYQRGRTQAIRQALADGPLDSREIAARLGLTVSSASKALADLLKSGDVTRPTRGTSNSPAKYCLTEKGIARSNKGGLFGK